MRSLSVVAILLADVGAGASNIIEVSPKVSTSKWPTTVGAAGAMRCVNAEGTAFEACGGSGVGGVSGSTTPVTGLDGIPLASESTLGAVKTQTDKLTFSDTRLLVSLPAGGTGLTDTELRAVAVPVSGTFWQATQPVSGTFWQAIQAVSQSGAWSVAATLAEETTKIIGTVNIAAGQTIGVTGTFWQATQPVSAAVAAPAFVRLSDGAAAIATLPVSLASVPSHPVTNAGTFAVQSAATLTAETTKVIGTINIAAGQTTAVTNAGTFAVQSAATLAAETTKVIGTVNIAASQTLATVTTVGAVTAITNALPAGANVIGAITLPAATTALPAPGGMLTPSTLCVTATAAANAAATCSLPSGGASTFQYITYIHMSKNATAALTGSATLVTTQANMPGSMVWSYGNLMVAGGFVQIVDVSFASPVRAAAAATTTSITMPAAGAAVLNRCNVCYFIAP